MPLGVSYHKEAVVGAVVSGLLLAGCTGNTIKDQEVPGGVPVASASATQNPADPQSVPPSSAPSPSSFKGRETGSDDSGDLDTTVDFNLSFTMLMNGSLSVGLEGYSMSTMLPSRYVLLSDEAEAEVERGQYESLVSTIPEAKYSVVVAGDEDGKDRLYAVLLYVPSDAQADDPLGSLLAEKRGVALPTQFRNATQSIHWRVTKDELNENLPPHIGEGAEAIAALLTDGDEGYVLATILFDAEHERVAEQMVKMLSFRTPAALK